MSVRTSPTNCASESPVTNRLTSLSRVGWANPCCLRLRLARRIAVEPVSSSVPLAVLLSWPKARSRPSRGRCSPIAPAKSSIGRETDSTMSRVWPRFMLSPARTIAAELNSVAIASAISITPSTRPAGIVNGCRRSGSNAQNWK